MANHRHRHRLRRRRPDLTLEPSSALNDTVSTPSPPQSPKSSDYNSDDDRNPADTLPGLYASYVNVAPLPVFRGTKSECPMRHLSRFTKVCRANNGDSVEMMTRLFPVTLEGEAALWYDLNVEPYEEEMDWGEIKNSFVMAYGESNVDEERFRAELMAINQGINEAVRSYSLRLQWILKRWPNHGISEGLLKDIFVDGLRSEFKEWIVPQRPCSLNDALRLAFAWETVLEVENIKNKMMEDVKCGFCDGPHEEPECEIRARMRELWVQSKDSLAGNGSSKDREEGKMTAAAALKRQKSICRCSKHQCWKKLENNNSSRGLLAQNSFAE